MVRHVNGASIYHLLQRVTPEHAPIEFHHPVPHRRLSRIRQFDRLVALAFPPVRASRCSPRNRAGEVIPGALPDKVIGAGRVCFDLPALPLRRAVRMLYFAGRSGVSISPAVLDGGDLERIAIRARARSTFPSGCDVVLGLLQNRMEDVKLASISLQRISLPRLHHEVVPCVHPGNERRVLDPA
jgi:hypothetical protein